MLFDDGTVKVYHRKNEAEEGDMPNYSLELVGVYSYGMETVGFSRYYTAMATNEQIDLVIHIDLSRNLRANDVAEMDDGQKMRIVQAQHARDEDNLWFTRLSLTIITDDMFYNGGGGK